jgi:hypothetical protein
MKTWTVRPKATWGDTAASGPLALDKRVGTPGSAEGLSNVCIGGLSEDSDGRTDDQRASISVWIVHFDDRSCICGIR